jgi:hypothetical protein
VTILTHLKITNVVLVLSPEALYFFGTVNLVTDIGSPGSLDTSGHVVPVFVTKVLECKNLFLYIYIYIYIYTFSLPSLYLDGMTYSFGMSNKDLCSTHLPFFSRDIIVLEDLQGTALRISVPNIFTGITSRWTK